MQIFIFDPCFCEIILYALQARCFLYRDVLSSVNYEYKCSSIRLMNLRIAQIVRREKWDALEGFNRQILIAINECNLL